MDTAAAARTADFTRWARGGAHLRADLRRLGCTRHEIDARIAARRWQQVGRAVVLHNGVLSRAERWRVGVLNCGPRAALASFSAAEMLGLRGWERDEVHVLVPVGVARPPRLPGLHLILHRTADMQAQALHRVRGSQRIAPALVHAASSFAKPRPACGILAAGVQQRLTTASDLRDALATATRVRHRRSLLHAVDDISMEPKR